MKKNTAVKVMHYLLLFTMASFLMGQSAWNTGDLSFSYQTFPAPAQSLDLSGDLISDEVPHEGVGGFELVLGDTNLVTLLGYDLYISGSDTLADIFVIFMSDPLPLEPGNYPVNPSPDALKIFVWLSEVNGESLASLLDTSFTLDSLASFNPFISASGEFEIIENSDFHFEMDFSGVMLNTSFQVRTISDGSMELWNTLPITAYTHGSVDYTTGAESGNINGALNPLTDSEGAGAVLTEDGDTLTYNFISYQQQPQNLFSVYGVVLIGEDAHFPIDGSESIFDVSVTDNSLPQAVPYILRDVSFDEIALLLESGEIPDPTQFSQLYLPVGIGNASFSYTSVGDAQLNMENILMSNINGDVIQYSTDWLLNNSLPSGIQDDRPLNPETTNIVGLAYPNPFNSSTVIPIQLSQGKVVSGYIYNLRGQRVYDLDFGYLGTGSHEIHINLRNSNLDGGLYHFSLFSSQSQLGTGTFVYLK
ncbi:MAG: hypothetical protein HQ506_10325 [Candidatus Marinimicrobia bacterium]|nr:hypothetical protein [Candidatus Neomarinimicrobiota bacterium]